MPNVGIITEQNDLGLGFDELSQEDMQKLTEQTELEKEKNERTD